jgi:GNAT superfamily N-acetyltransferase
VEIRRMNINDYDSVYEIWQKCGFELGASDSREEVEKFILKNPESSLVGIADNKIVGGVLGGYDGRRGLVHHLSVDLEYRKLGYGKALVNALEVEFKKTAEYTIPEEFQKKIDESPALKAAFEALTPGRQRAYILYFSEPKQSKTRESRIEKYMQQILNGKGLNDQ